MGFNRFRIILSGRIVLLTLTIFLTFYLVYQTDYKMVVLLIAIFILYQIFGLFHFAEKTNRDLSRFFQSVRNADFTQSFTGDNLGPSFRELNAAFSDVTRQFLALRSQKEEQFRYLQTVVQHVGIGLMVFTPDGTVELINNAAKKILNIHQINHIKALEKPHPDLTKALLSLHAGESSLIKTGENTQPVNLSVNATEFKLHGQLFILVSLQNIRNELERERMARELEIARHVQGTLLPKQDPVIAGFDIAGICLPAREVGGDYFDFIRLGENRLGIVVGDVSGKGVPAAIYMTLTKGILQATIQENASPRDALVRLNTLLYQTLERGSFVSLYFALLETAGNNVKMARAGHNPAILYSSATDKITLLQPPGIGLGLEKGEVFRETLQEQELMLMPGDWLVFYTDGFTEAMNVQSEEFGEERLGDILRMNRNKSAAEFLSDLQNRVREFVEAENQYDDMTIVAIKVNEST